MKLLGKQKENLILIETEETKLPLKYKMMSKKKIKKNLAPFFAKKNLESKRTIIETPRGKIVF